MPSSTEIKNIHGFSVSLPTPATPKESDFTYVKATISYENSTDTIEIDENTKFKYDYFEGINITNSFSDIKDFLTIWQYLKSERLVLEVEKVLTKKDYEPFFEYKPISETKYGKEKKEGIVSVHYKNELELLSSMYDDPKRTKDYRDYIDDCFEYNKKNETICSQFIDKKILGNSALDVFINKKFKTNEEISATRSLKAAYVGMVVAILIAICQSFWQSFHTNTADIRKIQSQITEIQQTLNNNISSDLDNISDELQGTLNDTDITVISNQLDEILQEIKEYKQNQ